VAPAVPHSWFTLYVQLVSLPNKDLYQPTAPDLPYSSWLVTLQLTTQLPYTSQLGYPAAHNSVTLRVTCAVKSFVGKMFPDHKHLCPARGVNQGRWVYERAWLRVYNIEMGLCEEVRLSYSTVKCVPYTWLM